MSLIDDAIGLISPGWKASRLRSRVAINAYEAALPVLYGQREIGGAIISAGIFSSDQQ